MEAAMVEAEEMCLAPVFPQRTATPATTKRMRDLWEGRSATERGGEGVTMHR